jgi:predicted enzyme related to lactoylglutathione lyase
VSKAGGKIETPRKSIGQYGFIALVVDTEGSMIGLHSMQ